MTFTGLYIIAILIILELSNFNKINLGILIGIIIPDLDVLLKYISIHESYHGSILHSIIFIALFYLFLLIINELNKKFINKVIINGIFIGMLLHIILDILFSLEPILIYWPLPISPTEPLYSLQLSSNILYFIAFLEFISLRFFGHKMILKIINGKNLPRESYGSINIISYWIKLQTAILLLFISMYLIDVKFSIVLMDFCMFSSIIIALYFLYRIKELTSEDIIIG